MAEAIRGLGEAELALGDSVRARDDARAAFEIADRAGATSLAGAALRVIASSVGLGAPGEADLGGAREMFDRSVEVLTGAGAELELARTFLAYADFEERVGRTDTAAELRQQAGKIATRSRRPGRAFGNEPILATRPSCSLAGDAAGLLEVVGLDQDPVDVPLGRGVDVRALAGDDEVVELVLGLVAHLDQAARVPLGLAS